jgi:hypothetical protein
MSSPVCSDSLPEGTLQFIDIATLECHRIVDALDLAEEAFVRYLFMIFPGCGLWRRMMWPIARASF